MSNPSQGMHIVFSLDGPQIESAGYIWSMAISGLGYKGLVIPVPQARLVNDGGRLLSKRGNVDEWYLNSGWGIEQGFTILTKPAEMSGEILVVEMQISGELQPSLDNKPCSSLMFPAGYFPSTRAFKCLMLKITFCPPARLALAENTLRILINDSDADYPIVIDPWIQAAKLFPMMAK